MEIYRSTTFGTQSKVTNSMVDGMQTHAKELATMEQNLQDLQGQIMQQCQGMEYRPSSNVADGTSFMNLQKPQEKLDLIFNQAMHQISEIFDNTSQMVNEIAAANSIWVDPPPLYIEVARKKNGVSNSKEQSDTYTVEKHVYNSQQNLDFPSFDGFLPRAWNIKCIEYLKMISNNSDSQKIVWAAKQFEGRAADWFKDMRERILGLTWQQFVDWVLARFYDFNETQIFYEFDKLKHANTYDEFVYYFGKLRTALEVLNPGENIECYYLASFLHELEDGHTLVMSILNSQDLYHEILVKGIMRSYPKLLYSSSNMSNLTQVTQESEPSSKQPIKLLSNSQLADKKIQDLCDEEYSLGQKCMHEITYKDFPTNDEVVHSVIMENILVSVAKRVGEVSANPGEGLESARKRAESASFQQTPRNDLPPIPIQLLHKVNEVTESDHHHDVDEDFFPKACSAIYFFRMEGLMPIFLGSFEAITYFFVHAAKSNKLQLSQISEIQAGKTYIHNQFRIKEEYKWKRLLYMRSQHLQLFPTSKDQALWRNKCLVGYLQRIADLKLQYDGQIKQFQLRSVEDLSETDKILKNRSTSQVWCGISNISNCTSKIQSAFVQV